MSVCLFRSVTDRIVPKNNTKSTKIVTRKKTKHTSNQKKTNHQPHHQYEEEVVTTTATASSTSASGVPIKGVAEANLRGVTYRPPPAPVRKSSSCLGGCTARRGSSVSFNTCHFGNQKKNHLQKKRSKTFHTSPHGPPHTPCFLQPTTLENKSPPSQPPNHRYKKWVRTLTSAEGSPILTVTTTFEIRFATKFPESLKDFKTIHLLSIFFYHNKHSWCWNSVFFTNLIVFSIICSVCDFWLLIVEEMPLNLHGDFFQCKTNSPEFHEFQP